MRRPASFDHCWNRVYTGADHSRQPKRPGMTPSSKDPSAAVDTATSAQGTDACLPRVFLKGQVDLLAAAAEGAEQESILQRLAELVESVVGHLSVSVLRYRPDANELVVASAPTLPSGLRNFLDGRAVAPDAGPLGTACSTMEHVVARDLQSDPRWSEGRSIALSHGFRSCWAVPIAGEHRRCAGLVVVYSPEPGGPSDQEHRVLKGAARVARTVIDGNDSENGSQGHQTQHQQFLEELPIGIYRTTPDGNLLYANPALIEMLGAESVDELQQTNVRDWYTEQSGRSEFKADMDERGKVEQRETRLLRFDGGSIDIMESARAVRDDSGSVQYYEGIIQDITQRKEAQRALRASEKKLRIILNNAQPIFFMLDAEGTFVVSEGADLEQLGLEPGEAVGESVFDMYEDHPRVIEQIERALNGESVIFTSEVAGRYFETWCTPFYDDQGDLQGCIGMSTDETERRKAQAQLRETKNFYEQLLDQHPTELAVFDREARYRYVNEQAIGDEDVREWVMGRTNEEFCREQGLDPELGQRQDEIIRQVAETGEAARFEETIRSANGARHYVRVHVPVTNLEGDITHIVGSGLDVTERVHYEEELRKAKEEAEKASRLKSAMLANMSHEVRTPLTAIAGFAEVLETDESDANVERFARLIRESSRRLMDTLDSVLQLSKLESGARSLNREPIDLVNEAHTAVTEQQARKAAEGIDVRVAVPDEPVIVHCDPTAVQRILMNLVSNSVKFTEPGGEVVVDVERGDGQACLEVRDTGIGMSEAFQNEMFEAFKQESAGLSREYEGSGLGLSLVKQLVDQHDGSLDVESARGKGTTIRVHLPLYHN